MPFLIDRKRVCMVNRILELLSSKAFSTHRQLLVRQHCVCKDIHVSVCAYAYKQSNAYVCLNVTWGSTGAEKIFSREFYFPIEHFKLPMEHFKHVANCLDQSVLCSSAAFFTFA